MIIPTFTNHRKNRTTEIRIRQRIEEKWFLCHSKILRSRLLEFKSLIEIKYGVNQVKKQQSNYIKTYL